MFYKPFFLLVVCVFVKNCESSKILGMFAAPVLSHQIVFKTLMVELAKKGHQVTVITNFAAKTEQNITNLTEIDLRDIGINIRDQLLTKDFKVIPDTFVQFTITLKMAYKLVDQMIESDEVQHLIKHNTFDLIFIEDCTRSAVILSHIFKAPVISISSYGGNFGSFHMMGGMINPIIYPLATKNKFRNLSMWDKIMDLYDHYRLQKIYDDFEILQDNENKIIYGESTPTLSELKKNIQLLFLNVYPIWDSNRPVPPNVIYLGGLHTSVQNELPKEISTSLDSAKNGVIYMSFGTTVAPTSFSKKSLDIFIKVFSKLPYDVYWKWSDEKIPGLPENIKMASWFPQFSLLRHPNVKLFITQGGLQSTDEAIYAGVPLIGFPMVWDQWFNVDKYEQLKIGIQLDINTFTEEKLLQAIETVIGNKEYKDNILNLRTKMFDTPQTSLERAVWWTEHILRNGGRHLHTPSAHMSWTDYYEFKIVIFLTTILVTSVLVLFLILRFAISKLIQSKTSKIKRS